MQSEQTGAAPSADTRGGQSARGGLIGRGTGGRFGSLVVLAAVVLGVWLVLRTALLAERWGEVDRGVWALVKVYAVGLVFDATTCLLFFVPALLVLGLLPAGALRRRPLRWSRCRVPGLPAAPPASGRRPPLRPPSCTSPSGSRGSGTPACLP